VWIKLRVFNAQPNGTQAVTGKHVTEESSARTVLLLVCSNMKRVKTYGHPQRILLKDNTASKIKGTVHVNTELAKILVFNMNIFCQQLLYLERRSALKNRSNMLLRDQCTTYNHEDFLSMRTTRMKLAVSKKSNKANYTAQVKFRFMSYKMWTILNYSLMRKLKNVPPPPQLSTFSKHISDVENLMIHWIL
jgi:hypothetical protein